MLRVISTKCSARETAGVSSTRRNKRSINTWTAGSISARSRGYARRASRTTKGYEGLRRATTPLPWPDVEGPRSRSWNGQRLPHARMAQRRLAVRRDEAVTKSPLGKAPGLGRGPAPRASLETRGSSWRRPRVPCPTRGTYPRIAFRTGPFQAVAQVGGIAGHSAVRPTPYGCNHFTDCRGLPEGHQ